MSASVVRVTPDSLARYNRIILSLISIVCGSTIAIYEPVLVRHKSWHKLEAAKCALSRKKFKVESIQESFFKKIYSYTAANGGGTAGMEMQPNIACNLPRLFNLGLSLTPAYV